MNRDLITPYDWSPAEEQNTPNLPQTGSYVLKSYNVKIFDMSLPEERKSYEDIMKILFNGVRDSTHYVWAKDRTFTDGNWKIYLEWSEYEKNNK